MENKFTIVEDGLLNNMEIIKNYFEGDIYSIGTIQEKSIIKCYDSENKLVTWCIISPTTNELLNDFIEHNISYLEQEEQTIFINDFIDGIYIDLIVSKIEKQGGAKAIIEYLKTKNKKLWLYSTYESISFYDKMEFISYDGEYIYYL